MDARGQVFGIILERGQFDSLFPQSVPWTFSRRWFTVLMLNLAAWVQIHSIASGPAISSTLPHVAVLIDQQASTAVSWTLCPQPQNHQLHSTKRARFQCTTKYYWSNTGTPKHCKSNDILEALLTLIVNKEQTVNSAFCWSVWLLCFGCEMLLLALCLCHIGLDFLIILRL